MRIGQNPAKSLKEVARPQKVTVAVLTYIPTIGGYYEKSLEVLKVCLTSIIKNTTLPFDLMIFDNASCHPVRDFLNDMHDEGHIQFLILSEKNYGKAGAWNFIFGSAPGKYIAYADSDVYHHPGWLEPQIQLLERFPKTGMVTGMPMWTPEKYSTSTISWAENSTDVSLSRGKYLDWEDYWRHSRSLGANEEEARVHYDSIENILISQGDSQFFIGAAHFQFVAPKAVLSRLLPIPSNRPMGEVRMLDIALNEAGYLRLCTRDWWVEHMGNTLIEDNVDHFSGTGLKSSRKSSFCIWNWGFIKRIVSWLYHKTFQILYRN